MKIPQHKYLNVKCLKDEFYMYYVGYRDVFYPLEVKESGRGVKC
jgi:hypothetical protein